MQPRIRGRWNATEGVPYAHAGDQRRHLALLARSFSFHHCGVFGTAWVKFNSIPSTFCHCKGILPLVKSKRTSKFHSGGGGSIQLVTLVSGPLDGGADWLLEFFPGPVAKNNPVINISSSAEIATMACKT